jgi:hypothetical protein
MQFIKNFFKNDKRVVGLCGIRKGVLNSKLKDFENYKKAYIPDISHNYLLF